MEEVNEEKGLKIWNSILKAALHLPGVKINRDSFLTKEFAIYLDEDNLQKIIEGKPTDYVSRKIIDKVANGCIKFHLTVACSTSAVAGIPGGFAMIGAIPADIAQFYGHVFALTQKLLYIYGYPNLLNEKNELDDETANILTIFTGVMFGCQNAIVFAKMGLDRLAKEIATRLPRQPLAKTIIYQTAKLVGKWIGIKITKSSFARGISKVVPLIGAPVSAGLTYWTFKPMAKRLKKHLDEIVYETKE